MLMFALFLFWVLVNVHVLRVHWILCSWVLQILYTNRVARTGDMCIFHSPLLMFHHPTELLLQSIRSKVKSLRIQDSDIRVLKQAWEPSEQGTFCDCTGRMCMKSACVGVCVCSWTSNSIFLARRCGEGNGNPFQYSCLENPIDGGAWEAAAHGVTMSWTWLSAFTFIFHFHALEKEMATHSSVLAWRIPGTGEPGGLPSMGSHRVGHNCSDLAAARRWRLFFILSNECLASQNEEKILF